MVEKDFATEKCEICGLPKDICTCEEVAREAQQVTIKTEVRKYGKMVTLVKGLDQSSVNINEIATELKKKCATGGTVKNNVIELQGNHKKNKKLLSALEGLGIVVKSE